MTSELDPRAAALRGLCPRCGAGTLFDGIATFARKCAACGLDLSRFNVGDGPAGFLTLLIGALITGLAIGVELAFAPSFWLHVILWPPITAGAVLGSLRYAKAILLVVEYRGRDRADPVASEE